MKQLLLNFHSGEPQPVRVLHKSAGTKAVLFAKMRKSVDGAYEWAMQNQPPLPHPIRGCDPYTVIAKAMASRRP